MTNWNLKELQKPVPVDKNFPDLSNDPFVLAKMEKAEKLIAEFGIPEAFKTKPKKAKISPKPKA